MIKINIQTMLITKYWDFINESKIELLLEAKITFSENFKNIILKIDSPVAKNLLNLVGTDVDINTNYIDKSDKPEYIKFYPDNRVKDEHKNNVVVTNSRQSYPSFTDLYKFLGLTITSTNLPTTGSVLRIERIVSREEIEQAINGKYAVGDIQKIYWLKDVNGNDYFMNEEGFRYDEMPTGITPSEVRLGKFVNQIFKKSDIEITPKELEEFVNKYKSQIEIENNIFRNFKIVSGAEIKKYYDEDQYVSQRTGTLASSCMRYSKCRKYLSIYSSNPNQVSLVVLIDDEQEDKVRGRALLWTDNKGRKVMDRIYFTKDSEIELFKKYADENGWYYKNSQNNSYSEDIIYKGVALDDNTIVVELENGDEFDYYPYMDTLKYYLASKGRLTNDSSFDYDYELEQTNGGNGSTCSTCDGDGRIDCGECGGDGEEECGDCDGSGNQECNNCDGSGNEDCYNCTGSSLVDCDECGGSGKDNEDEDCSSCDSGKIECGDCSNGKVDCGNCDGAGETECNNCDGRGRVNCYECDGDGRVDCGDC
jgi:hypothetical protein